MTTSCACSNTSLLPAVPTTRRSPQIFNAYRKGLQLFILFSRDGHEKGYLWAGTAHAANGRAQTLVGCGATVEHAGAEA